VHNSNGTHTHVARKEGRLYALGARLLDIRHMRRIYMMLQHIPEGPQGGAQGTPTHLAPPQGGAQGTPTHLAPPQGGAQDTPTHLASLMTDD